MPALDGAASRLLGCWALRGASALARETAAAATRANGRGAREARLGRPPEAGAAEGTISGDGRRLRDQSERVPAVQRKSKVLDLLPERKRGLRLSVLPLRTA